MEGLLDAFSMPYIFPHEDVFALTVGVLIAGLLWFRFGRARRRRQGGDADRSDR